MIHNFRFFSERIFHITNKMTRFENKNTLLKKGEAIFFVTSLIQLSFFFLFCKFKVL